MQKSHLHFMTNFRFHAGCLICAITGFAMCASAQMASLYVPSSVTFGGDYSSAFIRIPSDTDDWLAHFRLGAMVGMNIGASFNQSGTFNISGNNAANGIYDDGYVRVDQTGNAGGYTSLWGYNNASQYNAGAQTLSMHSITSFSTSGSANVEGETFTGFDLAYGFNLWYWKHARVGWEFGFGLLPINIADNNAMSATVSQSTYTFDTGGIVLPGAPYQGGSSGLGPIISGTPASSGSQIFASGAVTGTHRLDEILYTLRLGPSFYWDLGDYVGMSMGVGPAIGVVSGGYKYDEIVTAGGVSTRNTGSFGTTAMTFGGYANVSLMYHVQDFDGKTGDIYISAQYMPMTGATFSNGGREGHLNLGGQLYFSVGINWPF
jgi:hypothetical protein